MYSDLMKELDELRLRTARFRRVALHLHSPDSHDWGHGGNSEDNDRSRFYTEDGAAVFANELRKPLDMVAITDHMRCGFASQVSTETENDDRFVVLPGMEVNFRPDAALGCTRIHLLIIFQEGSTTHAIERLFAGLPNIPADDSSRTGQEEVTGISLRDWVERVHNENGLCIAAHVDNNLGVRCLFRQTSEETLKLFSDADKQQLEKESDVPESLMKYLFESGLDAVEITNYSHSPHYRWVCKYDGKIKWIPTVLTFDAHNVESFGRNERVTHIKMTHLGLEGLKDAFSFPDTRIRFPDNLPSPPSPRLLGIEVTGDGHSFFEDVTVALTENLNCLIGARGSGKSTLVEALRYVFGYNRSLSTLDKLQKSIRDMQKSNLNGCLIRVIYRTSSGDERILQATYDEKSDYSTKVYTTTGEYLDVADVEAGGEYPLRLFGWSEIETLGRSPAHQRDLLDRLIPELAPVLSKRSELRNQLRDNRGSVNKAVEHVKAVFKRSDGEIKRFKEFKTDFDKLNTPEVKELFAALDLAQNKRRMLQQIKSNASNRIEGFGDPEKLGVQSNLEAILAGADQSLRDWWLAEELQRLAVVAMEQDIQGFVRQAIERLRSFIVLVDQHIKDVDRSIEEVQSKLQKEYASDTSKQKIADLRANAEKRLRHVTVLQDNYKKAWNEMIAVLTERKEITDNLAGIQNEIAGIRAKHNKTIEEKLNSFLPESMKVSIDFVAGGDTADFLRAIEPLLRTAIRYKARRLNRVVATHYTPVVFASMLGKGKLDDMVDKSATIGETVSTFTVDDVTNISRNTNPFARDEYADVNVLAEDGNRLESVLNLQEVNWDDHETILLNGGPVNEKSPGQRSSAMLPLIALSEKTPLVIDQPEDNLDKRLIGNVLVKILAELKEQRQIIVCTHDPNILVSGDSEQVVVLEAESDHRGKVLLHGSIDNDDIVRTVLDLLEGGAEAFEARRERYGNRAGLLS
ncbi:MAG: TrlF family AAA-like ATPase [Candidatus Thiodiazotropha endolucinida]